MSGDGSRLKLDARKVMPPHPLCIPEEQARRCATGGTYLASGGVRCVATGRLA